MPKSEFLQNYMWLYLSDKAVHDFLFFIPQVCLFSLKILFISATNKIVTVVVKVVIKHPQINPQIMMKSSK